MLSHSHPDLAARTAPTAVAVAALAVSWRVFAHCAFEPHRLSGLCRAKISGSKVPRGTQFVPLNCGPLAECGLSVFVFCKGLHPYFFISLGVLHIASMSPGPTDPTIVFLVVDLPFLPGRLGPGGDLVLTLKGKTGGATACATRLGAFFVARFCGRHLGPAPRPAPKPPPHRGPPPLTPWRRRARPR